MSQLSITGVLAANAFTSLSLASRSLLNAGLRLQEVLSRLLRDVLHCHGSAFAALEQLIYQSTRLEVAPPVLNELHLVEQMLAPAPRACRPEYCHFASRQLPASPELEPKGRRRRLDRVCVSRASRGCLWESSRLRSRPDHVGEHQSQATRSRNAAELLGKYVVAVPARQADVELDCHLIGPLARVLRSASIGTTLEPYLQLRRLVPPRHHNARSEPSQNRPLAKSSPRSSIPTRLAMFVTENAGAVQVSGLRIFWRETKCTRARF